MVEIWQCQSNNCRRWCNAWNLCTTWFKWNSSYLYYYKLKNFQPVFSLHPDFQFQEDCKHWKVFYLPWTTWYPWLLMSTDKYTEDWTEIVGWRHRTAEIATIAIPIYCLQNWEISETELDFDLLNDECWAHLMTKWRTQEYLFTQKKKIGNISAIAFFPF